MNRSLTRSSDDVTGVRASKLARLRVGVFADGTAVGERQTPSRVVHVMDISADLDAPQGVTTYCGAHFAPGTLVEVPWMTMEPHNMCRRLSPIDLSLINRKPPEAGDVAAVRGTVDDAQNGNSLFTDSSVSIRVTAQWSVNDPVVYINHAAESECVDLAISGSGNSDVIAHFQLASPLAVLTAGHNLVSAGISLAETLGIDIDRLKAATPSTWWARGQSQPDANAIDEKSPDS